MLPLVAIACGAFAAYGVVTQQRAVRAQVGPQATAVVAIAALEGGVQLGPDEVAQGFALRHVPQALLPVGALRDPLELSGAVLAGPLAAGAIVTQVDLAGADGVAGRLRRGERSVSLPVAFVGGVAPSAGGRLDVIAAGEAGGGFAELVIAGAEALDVREDEVGAEPAAEGADAADSATAPLPGGTVTLRVTLRQAARLLAARAGGAKLAVLQRPAGDRRAGGAIIERLAAVSE